MLLERSSQCKLKETFYQQRYRPPALEPFHPWKEASIVR